MIGRVVPTRRCAQKRRDSGGRTAVKAGKVSWRSPCDHRLELCALTVDPIAIVRLTVTIHRGEHTDEMSTRGMAEAPELTRIDPVPLGVMPDEPDRPLHVFHRRRIAKPWGSAVVDREDSVPDIEEDLWHATPLELLRPVSGR